MGKIICSSEPIGENYHEQKVTIDNIPDLGDKTGKQFLKHLEEAIACCRELINKGYRLISFYSDPDQGIEFILKKSKE